MDLRRGSWHAGVRYLSLRDGAVVDEIRLKMEATDLLEWISTENVIIILYMSPRKRT